MTEHTTRTGTFGNMVRVITLVTAFTLSPTHACAQKPIPRATVARLQAELANTIDIESTSARRRAVKRIIRGSEEVLVENREAPNRFLLLKVVFDGHKEIFAIQQTVETRDKLFAIARHLVEAPDTYAAERLEADVLLTQAELATKEDSRHDYAVAIATLADRYRGTAAEAQSLMFVTRLALDVGYAPLVAEFRKTLSQRFSNSPEVGSFLMSTFGERKEHFVHGVLELTDSTRISFPPRKTSVFCFWSTKITGFEDKIAAITNLQTIYTNMPVYSFNLDDLRDGGKSVLEERGLNWIPIKLPGGEENSFYGLFNRGNAFCAAVVDTHGRAVIQGSATKTIPGHLYWVIPLRELYETSRECPRRLAVRHSIYSGEFFVRDAPIPARSSIPAELLSGIRDLFTPPPQCYRMTADKKLQKYAKIEEVCRKAIAEFPDSPDLWRVWNARMIALVAKWRLTGDTAFLDQAADHARSIATGKLTGPASVVPSFCITTQALLTNGNSSAETVTDFVKSLGGEAAPAEAIAAALILAVQAHSGDLYARYRDRLLTQHRHREELEQLMVLLGEPTVAGALFEEALPRKGDALTPAPSTYSSLSVTLKTTSTNDTTISLPETDHNRITSLIFMESFPPPNIQERMLNAMWDLARRPLKDLRNVLVLRNVDLGPVEGWLAHRRMAIPVVNLDEEQWIDLSRNLGVVAADIRPNVTLVHSDGRILHVLSGMGRDSDRSSGGRGYPYDQVFNAMKSVDGSLRRYDQAFANEAWAKKDYQAYVDRLLTLFPPPYRRKSRWINEWDTVDDHRRKVAWVYMQLKEWNKALDQVNRIRVINGSGDRERGRHSDQDLFKYKVENDLMMRAAIQEELGRGRNAGNDRRNAHDWSHPFKPKEYDLNNTREMCIERRRQARKYLETGEWNKALNLVSTNIAIHEAEPERCRTSCRVCVEQVDAMRYYAEALDKDGRTEDAAAARVMVKAMQCPSWRPQQPVNGFPVGRLSGEAGQGPRRIRYLRDYMSGGGRANKTNRKYRLEFGEDLWLRSKALEKLGQKEQAEKDHKRAIALVWPLNPESVTTGPGTPKSYVSYVEMEESEWKE